MKKNIITFGLVAMVASSSVYAFGGPQSFMECNVNQKTMPFHKQMFNANNNGIKEIMMTLSQIELSKTQWNEIRKVMFDMREHHFESVDKQELVVLINKEGAFDKERFIKNRISLSKEMIDTQAQSIEKILNILDDAQRKTLARKLSI